MSEHIEKMRYEMQLRCYAISSQKHYLSQIRLVEKYFNKPVPELNFTEIRSYFHAVICQGKSYDYINICYNALKFMFLHVLKKSWDGNSLPRPKKQSKLPVVLSKEEIQIIISKVSSLKHRTILNTTYA